MTITLENGVSYHLDRSLQGVWDTIRNGQLVKTEEDRVYVVDGKERAGKSLFALQQACYLDSTFNLDRVVFTPEEFVEAIKKAERGKVIIYDEAFFGLSSRSAISKVNKEIVKCLMEVGQKNLIIFLVMPSFFELDRYVSLHRAVGLFHVYKNKEGKRGHVRIFNQGLLKNLYTTGKVKHSYDYPVSKYNVKFFNKYPIDEQSYREKKSNSLWDDKKSVPDTRNENFRAFMMWELVHSLTYKEVGVIFGVSPQSIYQSVDRISEILGRVDKSINQGDNIILVRTNNLKKIREHWKGEGNGKR